nr:MAG TPA: hypothetical protein [Bacteriophage sp.]
MLLAICLALSTFRIENTSHFCASKQTISKSQIHY